MTEQRYLVKKAGLIALAQKGHDVRAGEDIENTEIFQILTSVPEKPDWRKKWKNLDAKGNTVIHVHEGDGYRAVLAIGKFTSLESYYDHNAHYLIPVEPVVKKVEAWMGLSIDGSPNKSLRFEYPPPHRLADKTLRWVKLEGSYEE